MLDAGRPRAQRRPGRLGRPGARRDQLVEGRVTGPGARPPLPGVGRARPPGDGGLPDHVLARRRRKRSVARRMADPAAVLPPATGTHRWRRTGGTNHGPFGIKISVRDRHGAPSSAPTYYGRYDRPGRDEPRRDP